MKTLLSIPTEERAAFLDRVLVSAFLENIPDHVYFKDRESRFIALSLDAAKPGHRRRQGCTLTLQ